MMVGKAVGFGTMSYLDALFRFTGAGPAEDASVSTERRRETEGGGSS